MNRDDLLRALASLIALEQPDVARDAATALPPWIDVLDLVRAADGVQQLAQALDRLRRTTTACATERRTGPGMPPASIART